MRSGVFYMIAFKNESLMPSKPKSDAQEQSQWKWENELGPYHPGRVCLWYKYFVSLGLLVYGPESLYRLVLPPTGVTLSKSYSSSGHSFFMCKIIMFHCWLENPHGLLPFQFGDLYEIRFKSSHVSFAIYKCRNKLQSFPPLSVCLCSQELF